MTARTPAPQLDPDAAPRWLAPLVEHAPEIRRAFGRRLPAEAAALLRAAAAVSERTGSRRPAAVLMLFSGPPGDELPPQAELLLTVRASSLRQHSGQAAFPGGATDPGDSGPVDTALREAQEETALDPARVSTLAVLDPLFVPPSGFHVSPVLAYSADPGPVRAVDPAETALAAQVPVRALLDPANRLMVSRPERARRYAGPAFLLEQMLVWGFTGQLISALFDVAGWTRPWDDGDVRDLDTAMALVGDPTGYGENPR